jgi:hypothetical protein
VTSKRFALVGATRKGATLDEARVTERVMVDQLVFQREVLGRELAKSAQAHLFDGGSYPMVIDTAAPRLGHRPALEPLRN